MPTISGGISKTGVFVVEKTRCTIPACAPSSVVKLSESHVITNSPFESAVISGVYWLPLEFEAVVASISIPIGVPSCANC